MSKYRTFPAPPKVNIALPGTYADNIKLANELLVEAGKRSNRGINNVLFNLDDAAHSKVTEIAEERDADPSEYLQGILEAISQTYLGMKAHSFAIQDDDTGRNITSGLASMGVTRLAELIGKNPAEEIYKIIAADIDAILEERYGPSVVGVPFHSPIRTSNRLIDIFEKNHTKKHAQVAPVSRKNLALAKEFFTREIKEDATPHWVPAPVNSYISYDIAGYNTAEESPPAKPPADMKMVIATANHVSADFIDALESVIKSYEHLGTERFEKPLLTMSTIDGTDFNVTVRMREELQRKIAQAILTNNARDR